ncbi:MAG: NAD(P)H-dependent oxidoreductase [Saprospiraceae bacterium]
MKVKAFGASYSKHSINKSFAVFATTKFEDAEIEILDLNDFPLPLFTVDVEKSQGIPENAHLFCDKMREADLIIISLAEHNGSYTAGFKNLFDWTSRKNPKMFDEKELILLSTSPGVRGAASVMASAMDRFPRHGATILGSFSLPNFKENFDTKLGILNKELERQFDQMMNACKRVFTITNSEIV